MTVELKSEPLYRKIKNHILDRIDSGEWMACMLKYESHHSVFCSLDSRLRDMLLENEDIVSFYPGSK